MKSWKTSLGGALAAVGGMLAGAGVLTQFSGAPEYAKELCWWLVLLGFLMTSFGAGFGLLFARDNDVSTEDVTKAKAERETNSKKWASFLLLLVVVVAVQGCSAIPKTIVTINSVVDGAMKEWTMASRDGRTTPQFDAEVMQYHARFNVAKTKAAVLWEAYMQTGDQANAVATLRTLKASATPLIDFLLPVNRVAIGEAQMKLISANAP
jgi:hypothetical protein